MQYNIVRALLKKTVDMKTVCKRGNVVQMQRYY
jgi:hypothetical protein